MPGADATPRRSAGRVMRRLGWDDMTSAATAILARPSDRVTRAGATSCCMRARWGSVTGGRAVCGGCGAGGPARCDLGWRSDAAGHRFLGRPKVGIGGALGLSGRRRPSPMSADRCWQAGARPLAKRAIPPASPRARWVRAPISPRDMVWRPRQDGRGHRHLPPAAPTAPAAPA